MHHGFYAFIAAVAMASHVRATVVEYTNKPEWQAAVNGDYSTIDFTGFADGTPITNQYAPLGVTFTGVAFIAATNAFVNDGWGLHGPGGAHLTFASPQKWIAVDFPGAIKFQILNSGQVIYTSTFFEPGGVGNFAGLVSDVSFNEVYLYKSTDPNVIVIDDLHWGPAIPAPGAAAMFFVVGLSARRRRA